MRNSGIDGAELHQHADQASRLLKTNGNPSRLMILCTLFQGEFAVSERNDRIDLSQSTLSQHLAVLSRDGLLQGLLSLNLAGPTPPPDPVSDRHCRRTIRMLERVWLLMFERNHEFLPSRVRRRLRQVSIP